MRLKIFGIEPSIYLSKRDSRFVEGCNAYPRPRIGVTRTHEMDVDGVVIRFRRLSVNGMDHAGKNLAWISEISDHEDGADAVTRITYVYFIEDDVVDDAL